MYFRFSSASAFDRSNHSEGVFGGQAFYEIDE